MILTRCRPRDCQLSFGSGRGVAKVQILKKWKKPYVLNWVEYFDKLLRQHWYWQDLAQEIAGWHFSLVEALVSSKFWKSDNGAISMRKHWYWQDLAQEIAGWHFSLVEALVSSKFWKSVNGAISWTEWNIVMKFCKHIDIDKMYPMRLSNDI